MKNLYFIQFSICLLLVLIANGQTFAQTDSTKEIYTTSESVNQIPVDSGRTAESETVFGEDGSVQFSTETMKLINDATYRAGKYPSEYLLSQVPALLDKDDLPFALWTLMNAYPSNQEQVRTIVFMLADRGIEGSQYLNAFYTYVFTDPEIFAFPEGEAPFLENPVRLEEKLESCQTLAVYSNKYLKMKMDNK